jgi:hypothetical protein
MTVVILAVGAIADAADAPLPEFKTYPLSLADPSNVVDMVSTLVGTNGKAFYDAPTRRLMLLASSNVHGQVETLMRQLNAPPRNVRIEVRYRGQGLQSEKAASVSGSGAVIVGSGPTRTSVRLQPRLTDSSTSTESSTAQQLLVMSGRQASIFVGENVPYLEWIMQYGLRSGIYAQEIAWQQVGATLVVEPTVIGDGPMIRVRLTPELSGLVNGNPYRTRFTTVSTDVIVSDGVPIGLGGLKDHKEFYSHFLIGVDRSGNRQTLDIELTAHIVSAP